MTLPYEQAGNGNGSTPMFQAPASWQLSYSFDCTDFGRDGRFSVQVWTNGKLAATPIDVTSASGSNQVSVNNHAGTTQLQIVSDCDWYIAAGN